jgi:hypothetical protein
MLIIEIMFNGWKFKKMINWEKQKKLLLDPTNVLNIDLR